MKKKNETMKKEDLLNKVRDSVDGCSKKKIKKIMETMIDIAIEEAINGQRVSFNGAFILYVKKRHARRVVDITNPSKTILVEEMMIPKVSTGFRFKTAVKDKYGKPKWKRESN